MKVITYTILVLYNVLTVLILNGYGSILHMSKEKHEKVQIL